MNHLSLTEIIERRRAENSEQASYIRSRQHQERYAELRSVVPAPIEASKRAYSKALYLSQAMRAAARCSISLQAQAVFAILIAESWWNDDRASWCLKMSQQQIANRGSCSVDSVSRHLRELAGAQLVQVLPGRARTVNRYMLCAFESLSSVTTDQHRTRAPSRTAPVPPLTPHRCEV